MKILCFNVTYVGFFPEGWKDLAKSGKKIDAVNLLRATRNKDKKLNDPTYLTVAKAKQIVEKFMG